MNTTNLRATRIGSHAYRYLQGTRTGTVISAFRHGFNALFNTDSDPGFVTFQAQDMPLHPWAVVLPGESPVVEKGTICSAEMRSIRFKSGFIVSFAGATVAKLHIQSWNQEEAAHALHNKLLIGNSIEAKKSSTKPIQIEADILTILVRGRLPDDAQILVELVGRGSGSTPAGDDVLLGMLAALSALSTSSHQSRLELATLRGELHSVDLFKKTTLSSAQMLNAAMSGSFPAPLCALVTDLKRLDIEDCELQQSIDRVLGLGATSGWFFLIGFMAAIRGFQNSTVELG